MQKHLFILSFIIFILPSTLWGEEARLLRFPTIFRKQIVFSYAGDLYTVSSIGGVARKITSHPGYEMFPKFSPDGRYIAFTGQYDGNTEVYLVPSMGGIPRRLTYTASISRDDVGDRMGPNNIVMGWKDNETIIFRSRRNSFNAFNGHLYLVSTKGDLPQQLPFSRAGFCSYSPKQDQLAYNRIFREFRTWKRYRGGMSDDIWIYNFASQKTINITKHKAQDIIPMWHQNKIYFLSDRTKIMNLFCYDVKSKKTKQITDFRYYDVKFPSLGPQAIVFENGGYIYRLDLKTNIYNKVSITIHNDMPEGRKKIIAVHTKIRNYSLSPSGKKILFNARGEIFLMHRKNIRNLTKTSGIHERNSCYSPDGKWIAFIGDDTREDEIYLIPTRSNGHRQALTSNSKNYKYKLIWSPDSKKIMWADKNQRLRYVDIKSKEICEVDKAKAWEIRNYSWSPDSQWICYSLPQGNGLSQICIYSVVTAKKHPVTNGRNHSHSPIFSDDGKYLFFISKRDFNPTFGQLESNYSYQNMERIFLLTLSKKTPSPFSPKIKERKRNKKSKKNKAVKIHFDRLYQRIVALPIESSQYSHLTSVGSSLYYLSRRSNHKKSQLCIFDFKLNQQKILGNVDSYAISGNNRKILFAKNQRYYIRTISKEKLQYQNKLKLETMQMLLDRHQEWEQIFHECWRQMRDFFFAPNMHGVNWLKIRKKYAPFVNHIQHRSDLTYIIGEMISELNAGHTYVGGGDVPSIKKISIGLLGAKFERDTSGYYRISRILQGQNCRAKLRSPLTEIGVNAKVGEYLISIDGIETKNLHNLYAALVNKAEKQVKLKLNSKPTLQGSRQVTVVPIKTENELYYYNWVENNLRKVNKRSKGKIAYIHIPDMSVNGLNQFARYYYAQLHKKAVIIDVRYNGGGWVSAMLIERFRRKVVMYSMGRNTLSRTNPASMIRGPKICLINEFSASDGDIFPYRFRKYKLGILVGKRSWGGIIGIRGSLPLVDGGYLFKPEFASYGAEGEGWIIEGQGVEPDIVVNNDPAKEYKDIDRQLNKAIKLLLKELKKRKKSPQIPPYPDKS